MFCKLNIPTRPATPCSPATGSALAAGVTVPLLGKLLLGTWLPAATSGLALSSLQASLLRLGHSRKGWHAAATCPCKSAGRPCMLSRCSPYYNPVHLTLWWASLPSY